MFDSIEELLTAMQRARMVQRRQFHSTPTSEGMRRAFAKLRQEMRERDAEAEKSTEALANWANRRDASGWRHGLG